MIEKMIGALVDAGFDRLWFTVKPDNAHTRDVHRRIGASEIDSRKGFRAPGDEVIIGEMRRPAMEAFWQKYAAAR
ncbi:MULTISPECIES: hypothetical protein [unclassified Lysobacter]|uniref:hypothetical protein n=1 Tax=unclassified Lysobacter TaxID=2635362 RepID=UPI001BEABA5F|nr:MULTISPECIES: hypothetical protein [unclassified Lysobacter]MBT2748700.1 hypothetical protein [Lysobacter sp. ISL-42]MBT2751635.1 hypothetical protein [Lysobacter sp. ISL-50]MBT2775829.1 hypothetical protein [Lysobacter sp. ISL-54]MBT2782206.1 hypothetical protein [Lysobacter sp. ISL-52]